ncbi:MAG: sialidase family protein [Gammaproteobacteria bacterium]
MPTIANTHARSAGLFAILLVTAALCGPNPAALAVEKAPAARPSLAVSKTLTLTPEGARNPTVAADQRSGALYLAWAQEVPGPPAKQGKKADPVLQVLVARSDDGGLHFEPPVMVNSPQDHVVSYTASPTQVAVGLKGEVYVLYAYNDRDFKVPGNWKWGRGMLRLARSEDGGRSFGPPVEVGGESVEGVRTTIEMLNLFAAPNGDLYASWLDSREVFDYLFAHHQDPPDDAYPPYQLRVARSSDGGRTFAKSVLVSKPTCGCCGTKVARGANGPLYATTRAQWKELKGSYDDVRDIFVSTSRDHGGTWSKAVKIHDDRFKISGCPDVTPGLAVDSRRRLHAAWYTGTDRHPGIFYARSEDDGKSFSKPLALLADDWVPYGDVKLALDAEDQAWVAFEDRRGAQDLIQVARVTPDGRHTLSDAWPGTAPDVAVRGETAIVTWGTQAAEGEEQGGAIQWLIVRSSQEQ